MQAISKESNIAALNTVMDSQDDNKVMLIDRQVIHDSVTYLLHHGFDAEEVQQCLVRYFYVDLDLLHEVLTTH